MIHKKLWIRWVPCALAVAGFSVGRAAAQQPQQEPATQEKQLESKPAPEPAAKSRPGKVLVPSGTRLPLVLHNSISTRGAQPGDPVYLETLFPIVIDGHVVIPAGSYVQGEIIQAKRPGKVKGRGELEVKLNTMILPNGYTVDFNAIPTGAGTGGNETVDPEGKVKGDSDKGSDAGGVITLTTMGAGVGSGIGAVAGNAGRGAGIGAAAGAAVGLIGILLSRGPELELPRGSTMDVILDRPLYLDADQVQFTDPGRASSLAGPPNRQPQRRRFPY